MADKIDITKEQFSLFVEKMCKLPFEKLQYEFFDGDPEIRNVTGNFDNFTVKMEYYYRDACIHLEVNKGRRLLSRTIDIPPTDAPFRRMVNNEWKTWRKLTKHIEKNRKLNKADIDSVKVQEVNKIIDDLFPDLIEKEIFDEK